MIYRSYLHISSEISYFKSLPFILKQQICVITTYNYTISILRKSKCTIKWIMMTLDITLNYVTSLKGYDLIFVKVIEPHFCWALNIDFSRKLGIWTNFESTWVVCLNTSCLKNVRWTEMCFCTAKQVCFLRNDFYSSKLFISSKIISSMHKAWCILIKTKPES